MKELSVVLFLFYPSVYTTVYGAGDEAGKMAIFALCTLSFIILNALNVLRKGVKPMFSSLGVLLVAFTFIGSLLDLLRETNELYEFRIFALNLVGAICLVVISSSRLSHSRLLKLTYLLVGILTVISIRNFLGGNIFLFGKKDMAYQIYSYNLALMICYGLYVMSKLKFNRVYIFLGILLIIVQLTLLLLYGGRGAFVSIMAYCVWHFRGYYRKKYFWLSLVIISVLIYSVLNEAIPLFKGGGLQRIATLSTVEGGSSRLGPWREALNLIVHKPILGWGVLSANKVLYAHNLVLNILLQFGLIFGLFYVVFIAKKIAVTLRARLSLFMEYLIPMLLVTLVRLAFSSSYLQFADFIFFLLIGLNYGKKSYEAEYKG